MELKVVQGNIKDALSNEQGVARVQQLMESMASAQPHLFVFNEAYKQGQEDYVEGFQKWARERGYEAFYHRYDDPEENKRDLHGLMVLARGSYVLGGSVEYIRMSRDEEEWRRQAGRVAIKLCMRDPETLCELDVYAAHLDDRTARSNKAQAAALLAHMDPDRPEALIVQANSMRINALSAVLWAIGLIARPLPKVEPGDPKPENMRVTDKVIWGSKRIASLAERLGHMASGQSIRLFERNGFRENGPWRQSATVTNRWRVARLDYILARNATAIPERPVINPVTPSHEGLTVITHRLLFSTIRTAV